MKKRYLIGAFLGTLHFLFVVNLLLFIVSHNQDWSLFWIVMMGLDFPFSLLIFIFRWVIEVFQVDLFVRYFQPPFNDARHFLLPSFFFGVLGTIWYFFLPTLVMKFVHKKFRLRLG